MDRTIRGDFLPRVGFRRRPLRVCVIAACPLPEPRGTPVRVTRLSEAVARLGLDVHVVTYGTRSGELAPPVRVHRTRALPALRPARPGPTLGKLAVLDPLLVFRAREVLAASRFDVIHAHHYEGLIVALAAGGGDVPVIYDAHTALATELPAYGRLIPRAVKRAAGRLLDRRLPGRARFTVSVSERLTRYLVASGAVPPDRIVTIGNGFEDELLDGEALRRPLPPGPDGGVLVYAGNLAPYQGIDHLLRAFRTVLDRRPRARLRVLTHASFDPWESLARELGVRASLEVATVPLERLIAELASAHVALNPRPRCDGVPHKNLNYMAAGTPLVAFRDALHPCVDGESGVAVDTVSGDALGRAVLDLLERPGERERLGDAARRRLEREHTWRRQAERVVDLYTELARS